MRIFPVVLILGFIITHVACAEVRYYIARDVSVPGECVFGDSILVQKDTVKVQRDTAAVKKDTLIVISSQPGPLTMPGFRIQIFSSRNLSEAYQVKLRADSLLSGFNIYLIYDPPYYKVRVGDFHVRYEANQAMALIVAHGFPNAWVVPDNIFRNSAVRK